MSKKIKTDILVCFISKLNKNKKAKIHSNVCQVHVKFPGILCHIRH